MKRLKLMTLLCLGLIITNLFVPFCFAADEKQNPSATPIQKSEQKQIKAKLLAISGSARPESYNTKALKLLAQAAINAGAEVTFINIAEYNLPIYDAELEIKQGLPENAKKLQALIAAHDGLLIASPEYNGLPTPLLKNILDWTSRSVKNDSQSGLKIFEGKVAAVIAASPGDLGGIRGLPIIAELLSNLGLLVIPERVIIGNCSEKFDANGELKDEGLSAMIKNEGKTASKLAQALKSIKE